MTSNDIYQKINVDTELLEKILIKGIFENRHYRKVVFEKFKPEYFQSESLARIFSIVSKHFKRFQTIPNETMIIGAVVEGKEVVEKELNDIKSLDFDTIANQKYLVENTNAYLIDQTRRKLMMDSVDAIEKNDERELKMISDKLSETFSLALSGSNIKELSMLDIMNIEVTEQQFIIDNFLPKGLTMLCGKPKRGKSFLVYNMAAACGIGGKLFEYYDIPRIETLYLALEDTISRTKKRIGRMFDGAEAPRLAHITYEAPRLDKGLLEFLESWLKKHPGIKIIFIDTLEKIVPELRRSGSKTLYSEDYRKIDVLKKFADSHGIAIIVVHHLNKKSDNDNDPQDLISGTAGLAGAADQIIILNRKVKTADACVYIEGRDIESQEIAMKWNAETFWWSFLGDAEAYRASVKSQRILEILEDAPTSGMKLSDIQSEFEEHDYAAIKKAVRRLDESGQIRRVRTGYYTKA